MVESTLSCAGADRRAGRRTGRRRVRGGVRTLVAGCTLQTSFFAWGGRGGAVSYSIYTSTYTYICMYTVQTYIYTYIYVQYIHMYEG